VGGTINDDLIHIRLLLTGAKQAVAEAEAVAGAMTATGAAATKSNAAQAASLGRTSKAAEKAGKTYRTLGRAAAWGLGILGVGGVFALKAAFDRTQDLGAATKTLMRMTNMDAKTASKWVQVTEARGIATNQLQMGMSTLAKQITAANKGGETQLELFESLGVSADDLKKKNMSQIIGDVAEAFKGMEKGPEQTAAFKSLFGRSGQNMMSLLQGGKAGLNEAMGKAGGIDQEQLDKILEAKEAQRDMKLALDDLVNTISIALIPALTQASIWMKDFVEGLASGQPWAIALAVALGALTLGFVGVAVAAAIAWIAAAGPIPWVVAAVALVIAGFVLLYKRVEWFRNAVNAVWGFIKNHWPLLALIFGPIAVIILTIVQHFGTLKRIGTGAFNAIKTAAGWVGDKVDWLIDKATDLIEKLGEIKAKADEVTGFLNPVGGGGPNVQDLGGVGPGGGAKNGFGLFDGLATGGSVTRSGMTWVGEDGPELLNLPRGSRVRPMSASERAQPIYQEPIPSGVFGIPGVTVPVYLDRRQIALAQAEFAEDEKARS
jgi:hypothetical protein